METFKKILSWIINILMIAAGVILGYIAIKKSAQIGPVNYSGMWEKLPGHKDKVRVFDATGKGHIIKLPKDENGKQITSDNVYAVGVPFDDDNNPKEEINVKIKHTPIDRTGHIVNNSDLDI